MSNPIFSTIGGIYFAIPCGINTGMTNRDIICLVPQNKRFLCLCNTT